MGIVQTVEGLFGKKSPMDQVKQGQPVMETVEVPDAPAAPQDVATDDQPAKTDDRSAFDCVPCKGEGLLENGQLCTNCNGQGKHLASRSQYPEGTVVVRPEGTFTVVDGQEVPVEAQK